MKAKMNMNWWKKCVIVVLAIMITGCGHDLEEEWSATAMEGREISLKWLGVGSVEVKFAKCDNLFWYHLFKNEGKLNADPLFELYCKVPEMLRNLKGIEEFRRNSWVVFHDSACSKRKAALMMGRCVFSYKFANYISFDGVSALIYNVAYICSIPRKALTGLRCSDGLFGYIHDLIVLAIGFVCAVIGVFLSTILGLLCHPFETLANLFVGV